MVNRDPLTGWTATEVAELRMWFSFLTLVLVAMSFMRWVGFLDYFRLVRPLAASRDNFCHHSGRLLADSDHILWV